MDPMMVAKQIKEVPKPFEVMGDIFCLFVE